ncbi:MAG: alpha/beta hydrolase [Pirellulales bacterium]
MGRLSQVPPWVGMGLLMACVPATVSGQQAGAPLSVPAGIAYERDLEYGAGGNQPLRLDLARPEQLAQAAPCIIVIHGGAWRGGDKKAHTDLIFKFAQAGYVAVTVQYRFCPQFPFPAQIEDVKCAVRFLRANAERLGIDPRRCGAIGFSAGAHLALLLGTMGPEDGLEGQGGWPEQPSQVQAVVAFFGPTNLLAEDLPAVSQTLIRDFLGAAATENPEAARRASPVSYVSQGDAPTLIFQGTRDPLVPHTQAYHLADAMTRAGVAGRVELLLNAAHGWKGAELDHTVEQAFRFFDERLQLRRR